MFPYSPKSVKIAKVQKNRVFFVKTSKFFIKKGQNCLLVDTNWGNKGNRDKLLKSVHLAVLSQGRWPRVYFIDWGLNRDGLNRPIL